MAKESELCLRVPTKERMAALLKAPFVSGAALYASDGSQLSREAWPLGISQVHTSNGHPLKGLTDFEIETAFGENWEPWE